MPDVARTAGINVRRLNLLYFQTFALTHSATNFQVILKETRGAPCGSGLIKRRVSLHSPAQ